MSVTRAVEIRCDGLTRNRVRCDRAWTDYGTAAEVRSNMRLSGGWATGLPGGIDLCPEHRSNPGHLIAFGGGEAR